MEKVSALFLGPGEEDKAAWTLRNRHQRDAVALLKNPSFWASQC